MSKSLLTVSLAGQPGVSSYEVKADSARSQNADKTLTALRAVDQVDLGALSMAYTLGNDQATTPPVSEEHLPDAELQAELAEEDTAEREWLEQHPPHVAASGQAPAGIVRIAGEELLEAIESEEDIVAANRELLEGRPLTDLERERWQRLFGEIQRECNKRLKAKGIVLLAACPEPNGLGGVLTGVNKEAIEAAERGVSLPNSSVEEYVVTITLPARERVDIARSEREDFVRKFIDLVCSECIEQQARYRQKQGFFN